MLGFSVVICTLNGANNLIDTFKAIKKIKTNGLFTFELLVIDNNSTDNTHQLVQDFKLKNGNNFNINYYFEPNCGKRYAIEKAAAVANSNWIVLCDDDNHLYPDYLLRAFDIINKDNSIGVLGGQAFLPVEYQQLPHSLIFVLVN